jgi:hypothetical protein
MQTQEVIEGWKGVAVAVGLEHPVSRGITAGVIAGGICYLMKSPKGAFRGDGSLRPHRSLSAAPDATYVHFILTPLCVAAAVCLLT